MMSPIVEEFFNRCHGGDNGKFCGTGTGGGHYKGRADGKPNPSGKSSASKSSGSKPSADQRRATAQIEDAKKTAAQNAQKPSAAVRRARAEKEDARKALAQKMASQKPSAAAPSAAAVAKIVEKPLKEVTKREVATIVKIAKPSSKVKGWLSKAGKLLSDLDKVGNEQAKRGQGSIESQRNYASRRQQGKYD